MPLGSQHFQEELQDLLDDRLTPARRRAVEQHLEVCAECRREFAALGWTRQLTRQQFTTEPLPLELEENLRKVLAVEARQNDAQPAAPPARGRWWWLSNPLPAYGVALVLIGLFALAYFILRPPAGGDGASLPAAVARDFQTYQAAGLPLQKQTGDVKELERFFSAGGLAFDTRVFDLRMMNYQLAGGRVHQLSGRPSALFVYRGSERRVLLCQMYPGRVTELPLAAALREHNGIRFYLYRVGGVTAVFWQEGNITCVLASDIEFEEVAQLAFAKAVKI